MASPTLKLDPQAKVAPLAPLALAKLVSAADAAQSITLSFEDGVAPTLLLPNAAPVEGYVHIVRELASYYAQLGLSGADKDQSAQVNLYIGQGDNLRSPTSRPLPPSPTTSTSTLPCAPSSSATPSPPPMSPSGPPSARARP